MFWPSDAEKYPNHSNNLSHGLEKIETVKNKFLHLDIYNYRIWILTN